MSGVLDHRHPCVGRDRVDVRVDGDAAERTASTLGGGARAARVDVTDAASVQAAVDDVVHRAGRLDLMFNNAGITWAADTENLTLEHWNSIIDINIRGVVHGVVAAYPQMIRQGGGFIVNTASMAGLAAAGQITSYVMTKHAVVGLSLALRSEAAAHNIGVLAICPAADLMLSHRPPPSPSAWASDIRPSAIHAMPIAFFIMRPFRNSRKGYDNDIDPQREWSE